MKNHTITLFIGIMVLTQSPLIHAAKPVNVDSESKAGTKNSTDGESKVPEGKARVQSQQELKFDEADAIFGKRTAVKGAHPKTQTHRRITESSQSIDHRKSKSTKNKNHPVKKRTESNQIIAPNNKNIANQRKYSSVLKKTERGTKGPKTTEVKPPTQVTLYDVTNDSLSISWMDNANNEYGVSVERGTRKKDRGGINYGWQHVFNVEERIDSNIKGTGWRSDGDDGLLPNTEYCYRLKTYNQSSASLYSQPSCVLTE